MLFWMKKWQDNLETFKKKRNWFVVLPLTCMTITSWHWGYKFIRVSMTLNCFQKFLKKRLEVTFSNYEFELTERLLALLRFPPPVFVTLQTEISQIASMLLVHFLGSVTFPKEVPYIDFGFSTKFVSPVFSTSKKIHLLHAQTVYKCR